MQDTVNLGDGTSLGLHGCSEVHHSY